MNKERKNLLVFGYGLALILTVIALRLWMKHGFSPSKAALLTAAVFFVVITAFRLDLLKSIYKVWMAVGHKISLVVSTLILSVLYFTVFSVSGVILRLMQKDLLDRNIDTAANSYWKTKKEPSPTKESFGRQF